MARGVQSAVKELVTNEMATLVDTALDDFLRKTPHSSQSDVRSVVWNVVEQAIFDLLCLEVLRETPDAHDKKLFDTDAALEELFKRWLASSSIMVPIATFIWREANTAMNEKKYNISYASKEPMAVEPVDHGCQSPRSRDDSKSEKHFSRIG